MSDLGTELKQAVAHYSTVDAPPLEDLVGRVRRRRRRVQIAGAAVISAAVLFGGSVLAVNVLGSTGTTASDSQRRSGQDYFTVPTTSWTPGQYSMLSHLNGELRFTADGCPYSHSTVLAPMPIAFPKGARGVKDANGIRSVVDSVGNVYATEHKQIHLGGGATSSNDEEVFNRCDVPGSLETFIVNDSLQRFPPATE